MLKRYFFIYLLLSTSVAIYSENFINKIIYKKVVLDYEQPVLINVFLNNKVYASDIDVFFNDIEIKKINKNLKSYIRDDNTFYPSFNFEVDQVKKENVLKVNIYSSPSDYSTVKVNLNFEKAMVIDGNIFKIARDKYFFIKAGEFINDEIFYNIEIENDSVIEKIDEIIKDNILYYKFKTLKVGNTKVEIFKFEESLEKQNNLPFKSIKIIVGN
jgi:hypothetical protein